MQLHLFAGYAEVKHEQMRPFFDECPAVVPGPLSLIAARADSSHIVGDSYLAKTMNQSSVVQKEKLRMRSTRAGVRGYNSNLAK